MARIRTSARRVREDGLKPCCLRTLAECEGPSQIGHVFSCAYEEPNNHKMIVAYDGVWERNRPPWLFDSMLDDEPGGRWRRLLDWLTR